MYFVFIYENRRMKPVEIVLRWGERGESKGNGGRKSKIYYNQICKYHNVAFCTMIIC
jgi:uncharacterized pyridoxamine 5'-phosphate oxidase family protein